MKSFLLALFILSTSAFADGPISPLNNYVATNITQAQGADAFQFMQRMDTKRRGQCYNRAYVWSYDVFRRFGFKSKKVLIYYTAKYRYKADLDKKWGFHIAPVFTVEGTDEVFDPEFLDKPISIYDWSQEFVAFGTQKLETKRLEMVEELNSARLKLNRVDPDDLFAEGRIRRNKEKIAEIQKEMKYFQISEFEPAKITCKMITHISEFEKHEEDEYCYLQVISMYQKDPPSLRLLEDQGIERKDFNYDDLKKARSEAFND